MAVKDAFRSTQEGQLVLVMPSAHFDLASYLNSQRMSAEVVQGVAFQLAKAVHYVHEQRFMHRDIKPANVLLFVGADSGSPCVDAGAIHVAMRVWLCDLGMARSVACHRVSGKRRMTSTTAPMTALVCTSWYRAPELLVRLDAREAYTQIRYGMSIDVWSYGAVVYEMLAGEPLARAIDGAGVVANLLAVLGPCPKDCTYSALPEWAALVAAAGEVAVCLEPLPNGWKIPGACLKWVPCERATMAQVLLLDWQHACVDAASPMTPASPT